MPISYMLDSICNLIENGTIRGNCELAFTERWYCEWRLKRRGAVDDCYPRFTEPVCQWNMDCNGTDACVEDPSTQKSNCYPTKPVHKFWWPRWNTNDWHFAPNYI